jgi:transcriptional regulator with XRE-family HTH domain
MGVIGQRIKELRKAAKLNQTELADALNKKYGLSIDRVMISKWETGFQTPIISTISCIANFFETSVDYLTNGDTNVSMPPKMSLAQKYGAPAPVKNTPPNTRDELLEKIYNIAKDLNENDIKALTAFLLALKNNRETEEK